MNFRARLCQISLAALLSAAVAAPAPAGAQDLALDFHPAEPVGGETFLVLVSGEGAGCWDGSYETTIEGNEVVLTYSDHCPIFGRTVEFTYRMEVTLPAGDWQVTVDHADADSQGIRSVTVRSEPAVAPGRSAGASLLFPYFEVDLTDPKGVTTLVAIGNASGAHTLARAVLWTDLGIPTLAFDLLLHPRGVQTINLRDVFAGSLPETPHSGSSEPWPYPSCETPVLLPEVSPATLRSQHSGQPVPEDGLCYSRGHAPDGLAVGYVTVDVVTRCSTAVHSDPEYFGGEQPVAGMRDVLWGDQFLVDGAEDFAQGLEAVVIPADLERAAPNKTFYREFARTGADARRMLPHTHLARAATRGVFDGGTDFLIWVEPDRNPQPKPCDVPLDESCPRRLIASFSPERGSEDLEELRVLSPPVTARWAVGGPDLAVTEPFTVAELHVHDPTDACDLSPPPSGYFPQMSVSAVMKAFDRFSVGFRGIALPE